MKTNHRYILVAALATTFSLAGCGGGGGSSPSGPVTSNLSFPVSSWNANHINNGYTQSGNITGQINYNGTIYPVTGAFSLTVAAATSTTFEGQAALVNVGTITGSETVTNTATGQTQTVPLADTSQSYNTTNYVPLGHSSSTEYMVMQGTAIIPSTVKVGDTAVVGTYTRYTDSTKSSALGTDKESYVVEADTANTAILNIIDKEYALDNTLTSTSEERWRFDALGTATFVSINSTSTIQSGGFAGGQFTFTVK